MAISKIKKGQLFRSNNYGDVEVLEYINCKNIKCRFIDTGYEFITPSDKLNMGEMRDFLAPTAYGVGYVGEPGIIVKNKEAYREWIEMLRRCYDGKLKSYDDVTVCTEWHDFRNFLQWHDQQPYKKELVLDKDLCNQTDTKQYNETNCVYITQHLNTAISRLTQNPIPLSLGVESTLYHGKCKAKAHNAYKTIYLGVYNTSLRAHLAYIRYKLGWLSEQIDVEVQTKVIKGLRRLWFKLARHYVNAGKNIS